VRTGGIVIIAACVADSMHAVAPRFRHGLGRGCPLDAGLAEVQRPVGRRAVNRVRLVGAIPQFQDFAR